MAAIISEKFRFSNATVFKADFASATDKYYMFLGKSAPWSSNDAAGASDSTIPSPTDDVSSEMYYWDDMLAAKNITGGVGGDVSLVVPRYNWATGKAFDRYEHNISSLNPTNVNSQTNLFNSEFYFITSEHRVYKVLDNNGGGNMSGTEPTSTDDGIFVHSSDYVLQYMFTITAANATKFLTVDFMPVLTSTSLTANPADGAAQSLLVTSGTGHVDSTTYFAPLYGDGSGGIVQIVVVSGVIKAFGTIAGIDTTIAVAGTGYTYGTINLTEHVYNSLSAAEEDDGTDLENGGTIGGSGGVITLNVSPIGDGTNGGHGYNPAKELGAHYVMLNTTFSSADVVDVTQQNDFRRVGIIKSPTIYGSVGPEPTLATASTYRTTQALYFPTVQSGTFLADEKITQSATGAVGKVVEWNSTHKVLFYVQERFEDYGTDAKGKWAAFVTGQGVISASNATGTPAVDIVIDINSDGTDDITFTGGIANSELQPDSGDVIYIENRKPITRVSDQTEDIKIIVEF